MIGLFPGSQSSTNFLSIAAAFCERPRGIVTCSQQTWWEASGAPGFAMAWGAGCVSQVWRGTTVQPNWSHWWIRGASSWKPAHGFVSPTLCGTSAAMTYVHCQTSHVVNRSFSTGQLTQLDRVINWCFFKAIGYEVPTVNYLYCWCDQHP
jgi:hypothetical protein